MKEMRVSGAYSVNYWNDDHSGTREYSVGMKTARYFPLGNPCRVFGVRLNIFYSYYRLYARQVQVYAYLRGSWELQYEAADLPRQDSTECLFPEPVCTEHIKIVLLRHHGTNGEHREIAQNPWVNTYDTLDNAVVLVGEEAEERPRAVRSCPNYALEAGGRKTLSAGSFRGLGVCAEVVPGSLRLENEFLRIGFSTLRPSMTELGLDTYGLDKKETNLLKQRTDTQYEWETGPYLKTVDGEWTCSQCPCPIQADAGALRYGPISPLPGLTLSVSFRMKKDALEIVAEQEAEQDIHALFLEAWRFVWDTTAAIPAALAHPVHQGANGRTAFPCVLHVPNYGDLEFCLEEGEESSTFLKVDTWRNRKQACIGIECGVSFDEQGELLIKRGKRRAVLSVRPARIGLGNSEEQHPAFSRAWGNIFGFRAEQFGMSNNASSINCHFVQHTYTDLAGFTETGTPGLSMLELCGYTSELALNGGSGYGDNRECFIDSDASLLISSATYLYFSRDRSWGRRNYPQLQKAMKRLLDKCDEDGLAVCKELSGNTGARHWSSNWWDVISFGHLDAFSNALIYRAFCQMSSAARFLGEKEDGTRYAAAAEKIRKNYFRTFYQPETGRLAGWKSEDGSLHDYAFLFINGIAIVYGLVPEEEVRPVLERLEALREKAGYNFYEFGLPGNLIPVPMGDYMADVKGTPLAEDGSDSYGIYQNGGATMNQAYFYLRALGMAGMPGVTEMEERMLDAFGGGKVCGGMEGGQEWRSWDGRCNGYEGLLTDQFYVLLAIAQNRGLADDIPLFWE